MAAPTIVTTARGNVTFRAEDSRVRDVTPSLMRLEPDEAPLATLLSMLRKKRTGSVKLEWFEKQLLPRFDNLAGALGAGDTTMSVDNYKRFRKEDLVLVSSTGEVVRVTATPSSSPVSIKRALGRIGATAAANGGQLIILGSSMPENSSRRDLLSTQKEAQFNYCSTLRMPFGETWHGQNTKVYAGDRDWDTEMAQALLQLKRDMDLQLIHGPRYEDLTGAQDQHHMGGVLFFIQTNIFNAAGEMPEIELEDDVRQINRYGKDHVLLMSPKFTSVVNGFARGKLQTKVEDQKYGVTITRYENAGRHVRLVEHKQLSNDSQGDITGIAGYGIMLDIGDIELNYMGPQLVEYEEHIEDKGVHGRIDEYRSVCGIRLFNEQKHGLIKGVTS